MSDLKKIEKEELDKLRALNSRINNIRDQISESAIRQQVLVSTYPSVENEFVGYQNELTKKYGDINLNMMTGEYTIKDEKKD
jgi:hypothetical protein